MGRTLIRGADGVLITTVTIERGQPVLRPDRPRLRAELRKVKVRNAGGQRIGPGTGDAWLKGLESVYRGAYLHAEFRDT